jgi:hypothetical protein
MWLMLARDMVPAFPSTLANCTYQLCSYSWQILDTYEANLVILISRSFRSFWRKKQGNVNQGKKNRLVTIIYGRI